jgi:hypothetical protein
MTNSCVTNQYFSGQGSVLIATKDAASGLPEGFVPVGNVSALTIGVETTVFQHKESCSGTRGIDKEITQEVVVTIAMTMESINDDNLALALYGTNAAVVGASISDELVTAYHDKWVSLAHIKVSAVVVGDDATPTTTYVEGVDYELNAETGSIKVLSTGTIVDLAVVFVDYDHAGYDQIEAIISSAAPERWIRFEGLNTADGDNPVVIDIYKASIQPLAELALINEELAEMAVEASALTDSTRAVGSQYFTIRQITTN